MRSINITPPCDIEEEERDEEYIFSKSLFEHRTRQGNRKGWSFSDKQYEVDYSNISILSIAI
jgi:hypothetical protein